jgi:hypothetical protein
VFPVIDTAAVEVAPEDRLVPLADALGQGTLRITEAGGGGAVALLWVHNQGDRPVLAMAGEVVHGGNQDRILAEDLVLPPTDQPVAVRVNCVEAGRWSSTTAAFRYGGRAELALRRTVQVYRDQDATWRAVEVANDAKREMLAERGIVDPTLAPATGTYMASLSADEVVKQADKVADEIGAKLAKVDDAVGIVIAYQGRVLASEVYGDPALFGAVSQPTLEAVAMDALTTGALEGSARPSATIAADFLRDVLDERQAGETVLRGDSAIGYALVDDEGRLVHLTAYGH